MIDLRADARLASPVLPAVANLAALAPSAKATWRGRMINEYMSSGVFEGLAVQCAALGLEDEADECRGFADEERRHGVLCGAVLEALGGEAAFEAVATGDFPEHAEVSKEEALARNLVAISCMAETVAVSLIGAERLEMPEGELKDLLTKIYADEVGHARFGWRLVGKLVADLDAAARARFGDYLRIAFAHLEEHELAHLAPGPAPAGGAAFGLCSGREARDLFFATVDDAIIPGLEALGLPARAAWENRATLPGA